MNKVPNVSGTVAIVISGACKLVGVRFCAAPLFLRLQFHSNFNTILKPS